MWMKKQTEMKNKTEKEKEDKTYINNLTERLRVDHNNHLSRKKIENDNCLYNYNQMNLKKSKDNLEKEIKIRDNLNKSSIQQQKLEEDRSRLQEARRNNKLLLREALKSQIETKEKTKIINTMSSRQDNENHHGLKFSCDHGCNLYSCSQCNKRFPKNLLNKEIDGKNITVYSNRF
jgi:hypothetical protein